MDTQPQAVTCYPNCTGEVLLEKLGKLEWCCVRHEKETATVTLCVAASFHIK